MYTTGNWIVHTNYGVGQIKGAEKKRLAGKENYYYRVEGQSGIFWLPVENANSERVRPVALKKQLRKAIHRLEEQPNELGQTHKQRQAAIKEVIAKGELVSLACLIRDLSHGDAQKKISVTEQDMLDDLKKRLALEWSVVDNIKRQEALSKIEKLIDV